jgi:hypothetical protein
MPKTRLTAKQRKQAEEALSKAQDSQTDFWDDLHATGGGFGDRGFR